MQVLPDGDGLDMLRFVRSTRELLSVVNEFDEKRAALRVLKPELTTTEGLCQMLIILGMVADMDLKLIKK